MYFTPDQGPSLEMLDVIKGDNRFLEVGGDGAG